MTSIPETRIQLFLGNDAQITVTITNVAGQVQNITGATVTFCRKSSRLVSDSDASFRSYPCDLTDPVNGVCVANIPASDNNTPGVSWYRIDVVLSGQLRTASAGPLEVFAA